MTNYKVLIVLLLFVIITSCAPKKAADNTPQIQRCEFHSEIQFVTGEWGVTFLCEDGTKHRIILSIEDKNYMQRHGINLLWITWPMPEEAA